MNGMTRPQGQFFERFTFGPVGKNYRREPRKKTVWHKSLVRLAQRRFRWEPSYGSLRVLLRPFRCGSPEPYQKSGWWRIDGKPSSPCRRQSGKPSPHLRRQNRATAGMRKPAKSSAVPHGRYSLSFGIGQQLVCNWPGELLLAEEGTMPEEKRELNGPLWDCGEQACPLILICCLTGYCHGLPDLGAWRS